MNAERLLAHYERIADAPDAIARLRRFILDLAVHGKLVEQDPNDEPASELLKRIAAEKARLVKAGEIGRSKPSTPIRKDELPFPLPQNWEWLRLHDIGVLSGGMTPSKNRPDFWNGEVVWLSPKDIKADEIFDSELKITTLGLAETRLQLYRPGSLFMVARSGILKRIFPVSINRVAAAANQDMKVLLPFLEGHERYLQIMFLGLTDFVLSELVKTGTTVQSLKYAEFAQQPFPLPPLAEQHRIVAKVDELMTLCDRLEAERTEQEATRDRLAAASLARLNTPDPDPATFRNHAAFALNNLTPLTTRLDQLKALRQTILNLAVRGKLVEQDPNDEPASELLKRIAAEKERLADDLSSRGRRSDGRARVEVFEFILPRGWTLSTLGTVALKITDGAHQTPTYVGSGVPFVSVKDFSAGRLDLSNTRFITESEHSLLYKRCDPNRGDILIGRIGTLGRAVLVDTDDKFSLFVSVGLIRFSHENIVPEFFRMLLNSPLVEGEFDRIKIGGGTHTNKLNLGDLQTVALPIPPLAEQHRIVAKVDELMALCNRLEASLSTGDDTRRRILDALLHEALGSGGNHSEAAG